MCYDNEYYQVKNTTHNNIDKQKNHFNVLNSLLLYINITVQIK